MTLERAAYVLAMAVLQSDLYNEADDELYAAVAIGLKAERKGGES